MARNESKGYHRLGGRVAALAVACALGLPLAFAGPAIADEGLTGGGSSGDAPAAVGVVEGDASGGQGGIGNAVGGGQDTGEGASGGIGNAANAGEGDGKGSSDKTSSVEDPGSVSLSTQGTEEHASWPEWFRKWDAEYREMIDVRRNESNVSHKSDIVSSMERRLENFELKADRGVLTESDEYELTSSHGLTFEELLYGCSDGFERVLSCFSAGHVTVEGRDDKLADGYGGVAVPVRGADYAITVHPEDLAPDVVRDMVSFDDLRAELRPAHEADVASVMYGSDGYDCDYVVIRLEGAFVQDESLPSGGGAPFGAMGVLVSREQDGDGRHWVVEGTDWVEDYRGLERDGYDMLRRRIDEVDRLYDPFIECEYVELADRWRILEGVKLTKNVFVSEYLAHDYNAGVLGSKYEVIGADAVMDHAGAYRDIFVRWVGGGSPDVKDVWVLVNESDIGRVAECTQPRDAVWTGAAVRPAVTVRGTDPVTGKALRNGTDYTITYKNNVNAGTATVVVTGKGNYKGSITKTFKIVAKSFSDVPKSAWYANVVSRAAGLGIMNGYSNGKFGPNDKMTRGQVAVALWNMAGKPAVGAGARTFPDVQSGGYLYEAVRWASSKGVISGYSNGKFGANDVVTREQFAVMLANYASRVKGRSVSGSAADYASMKDKAKVSSWAASSVGWCFRNRIMSGSNGNVNPSGNVTRAEAAKMTVSVYDMFA